MDRNEVQHLLRTRLELTGDSFAAGMLDTWTAELADVDAGEAFVAMRRAVRQHTHVQFPQFWAELEAHRRGKTNRQDHALAHEQRPKCDQCDDTGWRPVPDVERDGVRTTRVDRCDHRPPLRSVT